MTTQVSARSQASPTGVGTGWYSAHIYYYEPDKDALILEGIRPLVHRLRPVVESVYLVRHWRQGPHVRLHVRTDAHTWASVVQPQVEDIIGGYLRAHPSTAVLDERAELPMHLLLAEREQEIGPLSPWYPDNSIQYLPYDSRLHVLDHQEVADLVAGYLSESTEPLFAMLEHVRSGADTKELLGVSLMLATSHTLAPPITHSFVSYRSHAEGFLFGSSDPAATRTGFDEYYRAHRKVFTDRVRAVIATLEGRHDDPPVPFVREWAALVRIHADRAKPLIRHGLVYPKTPAPQPDDPPRSEFHQMMFGNRTYRERVFDDPRFHRYRVGLNCTYQQINRLGLAPAQRMRTCHLAANAVEDVYGLNAIDMVRTFVEQHPDPPAT
jgi:AcrR family transcriptional regulator